MSIPYYYVDIDDSGFGLTGDCPELERVCGEIVHTLLRKNTSAGGEAVRVSDSVHVPSPPSLPHVSSYIG